MKVTFIIKNMADVFYDGNESGSITGLNNMTPSVAFWKLNKCALGDLAHNITMKIGRGSFADKVDLNRMLKSPHKITMNLEPRRGYKLATFSIEECEA